MRQLLGLALLIVFYVLLVLGAAEVTLRLFDGAPPAEPAGSFWAMNAPVTGWGLSPGSEGRYYNAMGEYDQAIHINNLGLRSPEEIGYAKSVGVYRILVLGDSYVEALQVALADSFPQKLAEELDGASMNVEVINAGVSGWGTDQQLLWLREEGVKYSPDLVLLAVYPGNDFMNNHMPLEFANFGGVNKPFFELRAGKLVLNAYPFSQELAKQESARFRQSSGADEKAADVARPAPALRPLGQWLHRHSALMRYVDPRLRVMAPVLAAELGRWGLIEPGQETAIAAEGTDYIPVAYGIYHQPLTPEWEAAAAVSGALFAALRNETVGMGAKVAAVLLTAPEQVDSERWQRNLERYSAMRNQTWDTNQSTVLARNLLESAGIPVVDLLPVFRQGANAGARLHLQHDGHWTAAGHSLAAATTASYLVDAGLVPAPEGTRIAMPVPEEERSWRRWFAWLVVLLLGVSLAWSIRKAGLRVWLRNAGTRVGTVGELFLLVVRRRQYLLLPLLVVLLLFGALLVIAQSSVVGPFIYTLF